jgi:hypothetical protein
MEECMMTTNYTRMFPELARPGSVPGSDLEMALIELGSQLIDADGESQQDWNVPETGYTYLGQFIDHDLTFDLTPLSQAHTGTRLVRNFRTPFLDLDHLYGGGPSVSPFLYDRNSERGAERFLIGMTSVPEDAPEEVKPSPNDLPRNELGTALVGDPRQDENLILAQMHVAFLHFHNRVLGDDAIRQSPYVEAGSDFAAARRFVTWHYQWAVWYDFVRRIVNVDVFDELEATGNQMRRRWDWSTEAPFRIPVEFSTAAFRFGHSLVRDKYIFNTTHPDADLSSDLLELTGAGVGGMEALPEEWVIEWQNFFNFGPGSDAMVGRKIDTMIAKGLHNLPLPTARLFNSPSPRHGAVIGGSARYGLPTMTLLRGARIGLPTGQQVANYIGVDVHAGERISGTGCVARVLKTQGLDRDTPLWFYILREAELLPNYPSTRLGAVGSRIVADVIHAALEADAHSYLRLAPCWSPTLRQLPNPRNFEFRHILSYTFPSLTRNLTETERT